jgi:hypothetical protein
MKRGAVFMQTYGVALFYSTREAMKAEEIAKEA